MAVLKLIFLLSSWSFTGITAKDSPVMIYQLKNSSVCLHVKKQQSYTSGQWKIDTTLIASKGLINPKYENRVMFNHENMTLCISKLTESDTGLYKCSYLLNFTEVYEFYYVVVQGMVPTPVMTVTPGNHSSVATESCNFTVNCSIQDDWLESICHRNSCRTSQKSFHKFNITILSDNTTVVCTVNNHVSRNNISQNIPTSCFRKTNLELKEDLQKHPNIFYFVIIPIAVVILLTVAIKYCKGKHDQESTSSAQLIQSGPLESQQPSEPRASTSSSEADPSYENVETSQPREISILVHEQGISEVDTVYSVPRKTASSVKSDKKQDALQDENMQKTSTSGCGDVNKDQSSTQTETVYSVLQMPKNLNT